MVCGIASLLPPLLQATVISTNKLVQKSKQPIIFFIKDTGLKRKANRFEEGDKLSDYDYFESVKVKNMLDMFKNG